MIIVRPIARCVTISAETQSRNSADAQKQNAAAMTAVLQKIQQAGVPEEAIRTIGYKLSRSSTMPRAADVPRLRRAQHGRSAARRHRSVGGVIDAAATGGATTISGIRFDVRNRAALEREALRQAVADARARAEAAAAGAGGRSIASCGSRKRRAGISASDDANGRGGRPSAGDAGRAVDDRDPRSRHAHRVVTLIGGDDVRRARADDGMAAPAATLMRRDPVLAPPHQEIRRLRHHGGPRERIFSAASSRRSCRSSCRPARQRRSTGGFAR